MPKNIAKKEKVTVDNSGFVAKRRSKRKSAKPLGAYTEEQLDENGKPIEEKEKVKPVKVADNHVLDLSVGKLPTDTVHTLSKKSKYHEEHVYPNCDGPSRCIFNGPSGSGKTNFCLSLIADPRHMSGYFDKIFIFCPSAELQSDYAHLETRYKVPKELEVLDFGPAVVQEKWDETRAIFLKCKEAEAPLPQTLFLFDDLINVPNFDKCASTLMTKARHSGISVWVITQGFMTLSRLMRLQASNVFAFSPTESEIQRLAMDCTNAICDEVKADQMIRYATRERYKPFHFHRHAPLHTQYRKGLTEIYELNDPALAIHTQQDQDKQSTSTTSTSSPPKFRVKRSSGYESTSKTS